MAEIAQTGLYVATLFNIPISPDYVFCVPLKLFFFFFLVLFDRVSLCSFGWSGTRYVLQAVSNSQIPCLLHNVGPPPFVFNQRTMWVSIKSSSTLPSSQ